MAKKYLRADAEFFKNIPARLQALPRWVCWELRPNPDDPLNPKKVPINPRTGKEAKPDDLSTYGSYAEAVAFFARNKKMMGIGFEFFPGDGLAFIDQDGVRNPTSAALTPRAADVLTRLASYSDISPGFDGTHTIVEAHLPAGHRCKLEGVIEIYTHARFATMTGRLLNDVHDVFPRQAELETLYEETFGVDDGEPARPASAEDFSRWRGIPDQQIIEKACYCSGRFKRLWTEGSAPDADESLDDNFVARQLAFYTGRDSERVERLFYLSKLAERDKWQTRTDYRQRTVASAIRATKEVWTPRMNAKPPGREPGDEPSWYGKNVEKAKAHPSGNSSDEFELDLVPLAAIEEEHQEWLWENRIPRDELTNLSGDMDMGKSLILYYFLTCISNGSDFPDGAKNPFDGVGQKCLLFFSEGSLERTVKPRMMVMGASMNNILTTKSASRKGEKSKAKRQFYLDADLRILRATLIAHPDIKVIGFDPISNHFPDNCNILKSQDVRRVLVPLQELAEELHVTIIAIIHFNKTATMSAIHRTGGAAALVEVPRAAWGCVPDDDPENKGGFVLVRIKGNLGERLGGLCYRIEKTYIDIKGKPSKQPLLVWGKDTEKSADDLLAAQNDPELKGISKARAWLEKTFADGLARRSSFAYTAALKDGITTDCFKKARAVLRMQTKKIDWKWYTRKRQTDVVDWSFSADLDHFAASDEDE